MLKYGASGESVGKKPLKPKEVEAHRVIVHHCSYQTNKNKQNSDAYTPSRGANNKALSPLRYGYDLNAAKSL